MNEYTDCNEWLETAMEFRNKIEKLQAENKQLKEERKLDNNRRIRVQLKGRVKELETLLKEACRAVECSDDFIAGVKFKEAFLNKPEIQEITNNTEKEW